MAAAIERGARIVDVDALERRGEVIRVALATDLAIRDDVETRVLLRLDRDERGVVLRFRQKRRGDAPQLFGAHTRRKSSGEFLPIDEPLRLRIAAYERRRQQRR